MRIRNRPGTAVFQSVSSDCTVDFGTWQPSGAVTRQLELAYSDGLNLNTHEPAGVAATPHGDGPVCAICQDFPVMIQNQRGNGVDLYHSLCFRCYHTQMQRKRIAQRRQKRVVLHGLSDDLLDNLHQRPHKPLTPKYRALERRRRQAQMAARRERSETAINLSPARRVARAAALAGRAEGIRVTAQAEKFPCASTEPLV